jgi:hypothetical protein
MKNVKYLNSFLIILISFAVGMMGCSPLSSLSTSDQYSVSPNRTPSQNSAGWSAQVSVLTNAGTRAAALRLWPSENRVGAAVAPSQDEREDVRREIRVDVRGPWGVCDNCFTVTPHELMRDEDGGHYYLLPEVRFDESGSWTFRVKLFDPKNPKVVHEVRDQITIH